MGTTIALLRTGRLNTMLKRADVDVTPWAAGELDGLLADAIGGLWDKVGKWVTGDVAAVTGQALYTLPTPMDVASRIEVLDSAGNYVDRIVAWRDHSATQCWIRTPIATGFTLRFYGWAPYALDATDLPVGLEKVVTWGAAALAYGNLAGSLAQSQHQQALDNGRIVREQEAVALSAYWERRFQQGLIDTTFRTSYAPRAAAR